MWKGVGSQGPTGWRGRVWAGREDSLTFPVPQASVLQEDPPELFLNLAMRLRPGDVGRGPAVPREGLGVCTLQSRPAGD